MGDVAADGAHIRAIEFETGGITQFIKAERAVDDEFVFIDLAKFFLFRIELVLNITDQSSSTFSRVTMPTVPPNSSTTTATWACLPRKRLSSFSSDIISGTGISSRLMRVRSGCGSRIMGTSSLM